MNKKFVIINDFSFDKDDIIGSGSFSKVYKGWKSNDINFAVAIKEIDLEKCDFKYEDEIKLMQSIKSENVLKIYDYSYQKNCNKCYLILEFCNQGNLMEIHKKLSRIQALHYFR